MVVHSPTTITADSPSGRGRASWPSLHPRWRVDSLVWVLCMEPQLHWAYECNGHATSKRHLLMAHLPTSSSYIFFFPGPCSAVFPEPWKRWYIRPGYVFASHPHLPSVLWPVESLHEPPPTAVWRVPEDVWET